MSNREQMEKVLKERGMVYSGSAKSYVGNVTPGKDSDKLGHSADTFGYYRRSDGIWIVFVTDSERGVELESYTCNSDDEAFDKVFNLAESHNFIDTCEKTIANFEEKEPVILSYLMKEYNYSEKKADKALEYLKQNKYVAFEFLYYIENGVFVPEKYATEYYGYTVAKLSQRDDLTLLGAFNYLIYLQKKPEEALANIKKGLPRRKYYSEKDLEEVQKNMDEKDVTTGEGMETTVNEEQNANEAVVTNEADPANEAASSQDELLAKLEAVQQSLANLQQSFDDKIAEDTHKNGLFDNMHRELIRYQNGALDKIVDTMALDIIQLVDTTKGHVRVYEQKDPTEENYKKLLRIVKGIAEDLDDILYRQNIESYRVPGHEVDVHKQKIIQTVPTDDKEKDNRIAYRVADGYAAGDKILRPERIKIFKYEANSDNSSEK